MRRQQFSGRSIAEQCRTRRSSLSGAIAIYFLYQRRKYILRHKKHLSRNDTWPKQRRLNGLSPLGTYMRRQTVRTVTNSYAYRDALKQRTCARKRILESRKSNQPFTHCLPGWHPNKTFRIHPAIMSSLEEYKRTFGHQFMNESNIMRPTFLISDERIVVVVVGGSKMLFRCQSAFC
jgi:hypothetical protein